MSNYKRNPSHDFPEADEYSFGHNPKRLTRQEASRLGSGEDIFEEKSVSYGERMESVNIKEGDLVAFRQSYKDYIDSLRRQNLENFFKVLKVETRAETGAVVLFVQNSSDPSKVYRFRAYLFKKLEN